MTTRKVIKNRKLSDFIKYLIDIEHRFINATGCVPYVWELTEDDLKLTTEIEKISPSMLTCHETRDYSVKKFKWIS